MNESLTNFGHNVILGVLGRGPTSILYRARHDRLSRYVALKVSTPSPDHDSNIRRGRFLLEARAIASMMEDLNVPKIYEVAEDDSGQLYYSRELIEGYTMEQRLNAGMIDLRSGCRIISIIARTLQRVHVNGFAHRNLHPSNVLIAHDGVLKLIGFGRVGILAGSELLSEGVKGIPLSLDVRGLQDLLCWLVESTSESTPANLLPMLQPNAASNANEFADRLVRIVQS